MRVHACVLGIVVVVVVGVVMFLILIHFFIIVILVVVLHFRIYVGRVLVRLIHLDIRVLFLFVLVFGIRIIRVDGGPLDGRLKKFLYLSGLAICISRISSESISL